MASVKVAAFSATQVPVGRRAVHVGVKSRESRCIAPGRRLSVRVAASESENKVVREYREGDDDVTTPQAEQSGGSVYADQLKDPPRSDMSPEMKKRLRDEYLGLGGSASTPMGANYFLYIILGISFLAVLSWLTGAI